MFEDNIFVWVVVNKEGKGGGGLWDWIRWVRKGREGKGRVVVERVVWSWRERFIWLFWGGWGMLVGGLLGLIVDGVVGGGVMSWCCWVGWLWGMGWVGGCFWGVIGGKVFGWLVWFCCGVDWGERLVMVVFGWLWGGIWSVILFFLVGFVFWEFVWFWLLWFWDVVVLDFVGLWLMRFEWECCWGWIMFGVIGVFVDCGLFFFDFWLLKLGWGVILNCEMVLLVIFLLGGVWELIRRLVRLIGLEEDFSLWDFFVLLWLFKWEGLLFELFLNSILFVREENVLLFCWFLLLEFVVESDWIFGLVGCFRNLSGELI